MTDEKGQKIRAEGGWYSGTVPHAHYLLQPGQFVEVPAPHVGVGLKFNEEDYRKVANVGNVIRAKVGQEVHIAWEMKVPGIELRWEGKGKFLVPAEGEWVGTLTTGIVKFKVTEAKAGDGKVKAPKPADPGAGQAAEEAAADEPKPKIPPDPAAPVIEGLDLSQVKGIAAQSKDLPDLYEPDPGNAGFWRQRADVFPVPLAEGTWLKYPVLRGRFYIEHRSDQNKPETERYYGPFEGDPFEKLKLEEKMARRLQDDTLASDDVYRIELLLRTADAGLARRALRLMEGSLGGAGPIHRKESFLATYRQALEKNAALFEKHDLLMECAAVFEKLDQTEKELDRLTLARGDEDYVRPDGNDKAVPKDIPDAAWGKTVKGLRAAAVPEVLALQQGGKVSFTLVVENVSKGDIKFPATDLIQEAHAEVNRSIGEKLDAKTVWYSGWKIPTHYWLKPGERIVLANPSVAFLEKEADLGHGQANVIAAPGEYDVHYRFNLGMGSHWVRQDDGVMRRTAPAKGEWKGTLITGAMRIRVVDPNLP